MTDTAGGIAPRSKLVMALAATYLATGTTFIALKVATGSVSPFALTSFRLLGAALLLGPFALWRLRDRAVWPSLGETSAAVISGLLLFTIGQSGLAFGFSVMPAGIASVLGSAAPLFIVIFSAAFLHERLGGRTVAGVLLGFAGITALTWSAPEGEIVLIGVVALLLASAAWAAGSLYGRQASLPSDPIVSVTLQLLAGGLMTIPLVFLIGDGLPDLSGMPTTAWGGIVYLVIAAVFAFQAFSWLNQNTSSTIANTFLFVAPVIALILSAIFLGETLTIARVVAAAIALTGVTLILR